MCVDEYPLWQKVHDFVTRDTHTRVRSDNKKKQTALYDTVDIAEKIYYNAGACCLFFFYSSSMSISMHAFDDDAADAADAGARCLIVEVAAAGRAEAVGRVEAVTA
jgi:hypothetical protein